VSKTHMHGMNYNEVNVSERSATLWDPYATRASGERAWVGAQLYMFGIRIPKPQAPALGRISHKDST